MMDRSTLPWILIAGAVSYSWYKTRRARVPLPPGPEGHWLFGSAMELANAEAFWLTLGEYADKHGPLISVRMMHQYAFVISDPHIVAELFEKRAANYSDRDVNEMAKLIGLDTDIVLLQYGPKFKRYRTMLNQALNNRVAQDYIPLQEQEAKKFMKRLLEDPERFLDHVRLLAASIVARVAYGYKIESFDDPYVKTAEKWMEGFSDFIQPWSYLVNVIPQLRYLPDWLPIAPFQRRAIELRKVFSDLRGTPFAYVHQQMAAGTAQDSFTLKLLQPEDGNSVDDQTKEDIKRIGATFYAAGSDTTVSAVQSFFLAMTLYPEAQSKAQAEITSYLGSAPRRMILPKDRDNLPYTSALVKEVLRWHPIVPMVTHQSSKKDDEDVVCEGKIYRIPANSMVMANVWRMMHDPDVYPDPERFVPGRFLVDDPPPGPEVYIFGFGRRSCPGIHIAQQSMWITISNLLTNFNVAKSKDENGIDITPEELYTNGVVSHPKPFVCSIMPRDGYKEWLQGVDE